jgi:hypothetical protein
LLKERKLGAASLCDALFAVTPVGGSNGNLVVPKTRGLFGWPEPNRSFANERNILFIKRFGFSKRGNRQKSHIFSNSKGYTPIP